MARPGLPAVQSGVCGPESFPGAAQTPVLSGPRRGGCASTRKSCPVPARSDFGLAAPRLPGWCGDNGESHRGDGRYSVAGVRARDKVCSAGSPSVFRPKRDPVSLECSCLWGRVSEPPCCPPGLTLPRGGDRRRHFQSLARIPRRHLPLSHSITIDYLFVLQFELLNKIQLSKFEDN